MRIRLGLDAAWDVDSEVVAVDSDVLPNQHRRRRLPPS
jgi:hypothetical protein